MPPAFPEATIPSNQKPPLVQPETVKSILKFLGVIAGLAVLIAASFTLLNFLKNQSAREEEQKKQQIASLAQPEPTPPPSFEETHPTLFFADIEYNPETKVSTLLKTGKINGDLPLLNPTEPPDLPTQFRYKIEVISKDGRLIQYGWMSTPKERILSAEGIFQLFLLSQYKQESTIQLILPDEQVIWTGLME